MGVRIEHGDSRELLKAMAADSVHSIVTDPPYSLVSIQKRFGKPGSAAAKGGVYNRAARGFMGKTWDNGETAFDPAFWGEAWRVLKPGGHLLAFGGTRTFHRLVCAIEDGGFEIRDTIGWLFGSGFPKSHNVARGIDKAAGAEREVIGVREYAGGHVQRSSQDKLAPPIGTFIRTQDDRLETAPATDAARQWEGWGTALKPAMELICVARKPLGEGTVAANVLAHGTGAINIDGCRVESAPYDAPGDRGQTGDARQMDYALTAGKAHSLGRWPANVCHDGSEEVLAAFPDGRSAGNYPSNSRGAGNGTTYLPLKDQGPLYADSGSVARFFYSSKADAADRLQSKHPTVKPVDLMRWLVRLVTPKGGLVLDPFAGSGTTGMACMAEGFDCILLEREAEYVADIRHRVAHVSGQDAPLFAQTEVA